MIYVLTHNQRTAMYEDKHGNVVPSSFIAILQGKHKATAPRIRVIFTPIKKRTCWVRNQDFFHRADTPMASYAVTLPKECNNYYDIKLEETPC